MGAGALISGLRDDGYNKVSIVEQKSSSAVNLSSYADARIGTELPNDILEEMTPVTVVANALQKAVESGNESLAFLALGR